MLIASMFTLSLQRCPDDISNARQRVKQRAVQFYTTLVTNGILDDSVFTGKCDRRGYRGTVSITETKQSHFARAFKGFIKRIMAGRLNQYLVL